MMLNYTFIDILTERDVLWAPRNKRPEKLRDVLKEVEASFTIMNIIFIVTIYIHNG